MDSVRAVSARVMLLLALAPATALGRPTLNPPPLPAPAGAVVNVSTEVELQAAVRALASNTTILIAPGTYRLTATLQLRGPYTNVAIRGRNSREDVILLGPGMTRPSEAVPYGVWIGGDVKGVLIANLTIRDFSRHAIILNPGTGHPRVYNVRLVDAGQQFIKSNPDAAGGGVDNGIVEYSVIEYTTTAPSDYTNGIDIHAGANWTIRDNLFRNIVAPGGALAGPAVLVWNHSRNTVTERNRFLNCARGIAYGLEVAGFDHTGGIIRNNMFFRSRGQPGDVGIIVADSPNTQVLHNTVITSGTYRTPIEYRYAGARGVVIQNNLVDGVIAARDGATATVSHNVIDAVPGMFADAVTGDLRLVASAQTAIDRGLRLAAVTDDWDGNARPSGTAPDIGAIEFAGRRAAASPTAVATATVSKPAAPRMEPVRALPPPEGRARFVQAGDLVYQGAFRLPQGTFGGSSFGYAATGLAFNPARGSLFITGHDWHQLVAEISVPAIRNSSKLAELATSTILQPFSDVTEGLLKTINPGDENAKKIGGLLVYQNRLYATGYAYYDGAKTQRLSHFVSGVDLGIRGDVRGPFVVGQTGASFVSGYFGLVPQAWQAAFGGAVINGQCCIAIVSRTSYGPALFTIDPTQLGIADPLPARPLVYYPSAHPLLQPGSTGDGWSNTSRLFNGTSQVRGVVFPEGTASVLFFGKQGVGDFCYGPGTGDRTKAGKPATDVGDTRDSWCYDPTDDSKGTHAYPYDHYVWAYSAYDLAAVAAGKKEPWELQPYATWSLTLPFSTSGSAHINGAAYDPATNRIFVSRGFSEGEQPVIHVFSVRSPAPGKD